MKRDFDLIRKILLQLEERETIHEEIMLEPIGEHSIDSVVHHYAILKETGLIEAYKIYYDIPFAVNLTWRGHDFLDNARNQTVWDKTKTFVKDKGMSVSLDVFAELLKQATKKQFNLE